MGVNTIHDLELLAVAVKLFQLSLHAVWRIHLEFRLRGFVNYTAGHDFEGLNIPDSASGMGVDAISEENLERMDDEGVLFWVWNSPLLPLLASAKGQEVAHVCIRFHSERAFCVGGSTGWHNTLPIPQNKHFKDKGKSIGTPSHKDVILLPLINVPPSSSHI